MNIRYLLTIVLTLPVSCLILFTSCKKNTVDGASGFVKIETVDVSATYFSASCGGVVSDTGGLTITARGVCWSTQPYPTIDSERTIDGFGKGSFTSTLHNLTPSQTYYVRAYALTSAGTFYGGTIVFITPGWGTVTDIDGNVYHIIRIGTPYYYQEWMFENYKTTRYRNGDPIPEVTGKSEWTSCTGGAYCNYENDVNNVATYGRLYNWYAVNDPRSIAPEGWRVPTVHDWIRLVKYTGGNYNTGYYSNLAPQLKESGTRHWYTPNTGGTNTIGFTALPGGFRTQFGQDVYMGRYGKWWTADTCLTDSNYASYMKLYFYNCDEIGNFWKTSGYSIRCIKDSII